MCNNKKFKLPSLPPLEGRKGFKKSPRRLIRKKVFLINKKYPYLMTYPFLAGLIDGDGHIITYTFTGEFRIAGPLADRPLFNQLVSLFGGSIHKGNNLSICYRLNAKNAKKGKSTLLDFATGLNGHIRNTCRVPQFVRLCNALGIQYVEADLITPENGYIAGLFLSDGCIFINCQKSAVTKKGLAPCLLYKTKENTIIQPHAIDVQTDKPLAVQRLLNGIAPVVTISISNRDLVNIGGIARALGFGTYAKRRGDQRAPRGHYNFEFKKKSEVLAFLDYMYKYKSCSIKQKRLDLVKTFYSLKERKAHLHTEITGPKKQVGPLFGPVVFNQIKLV